MSINFGVTNDPLDYMFNNFFDWDKRDYRFNRAEKDMSPYTEIHKDGKIILIHNVVGIDKKDLKVSTKTENQITYLCINGKTKDELTGQEYFINSKFSVKSVITDKVTSELKNGLLYITIPCEDKNSEEKNIEIK